MTLEKGIRYKTCLAMGLLIMAAGAGFGLKRMHFPEDGRSMSGVYEVFSEFTWKKEGEWKVKGGCQIVGEKKKIALTFDDGPHPYYTEQLLDGLKKRKVKATFFVTGEHADLHPEVILRMQEEGHLIGNHTYSHLQLGKNNQEAFREELVRTNRIIKEITGEEVAYVRPPYGTWDKNLEKELDMIPVLWSIDPLDWCSDDIACIKEHVLSRAGENEIILMHDAYPATVTAALEIVDCLLEKGYEFVTVEEILME